MNSGVGRTPSVFVSSTCYDLSLVRAELYKIITDELGYNAVMSEYNSFPVNPGINPIDNCKTAVRGDIDIFILIVGCRLGYVTTSGKSITNLEYLNAKARGIPIYVFVDERVVNAISLWRANKEGDFSSIVDNPNLFKFVDEIRSNDQMWVFNFRDVSDIVSTLKKQLGYLLFESLKLRNKVYANPLSMKVKELEGEELYIAIERPIGWEHMLFGLLFEKRLRQYRDLKNDLLYGISSNKVKEMNEFDEIAKFSLKTSNELKKWINSLNLLINEVLPVAFGELGEDGDVDMIIYCSNRFGDIYGDIIKTSLNFQSIKVDKIFERLVTAVLNVYMSPINDIEEYCIKYKEAISIIKTHDHKRDEKLKIDLTLSIGCDLSEFDCELKNLCSMFNIPYEEND